MKKITLFSMLMLVNASFACETYEALVSGEVTSINTLNDGSCVVKLGEYDYFQSHVFCPLTQSDISKEGVTLNKITCDNLAVGKSLDGVLVQLSNNTIILD